MEFSLRKTSGELTHKITNTLRDRVAYDGSTRVRAFEFARRTLLLAVEARTPSRVESLAFCALSATHGDSLAHGESSERRREREKETKTYGWEAGLRV